MYTASLVLLILTRYAHSCSVVQSCMHLQVCRPLGVEVYKVHSDVLQGWKSPEKAAYAGRHGFAAKAWA